MMASQATTVYLVFLDDGIPYLESEELTRVTNQRLLESLEEECHGIDFIARDISQAGTEMDAVVDELESNQDSYDGVICVGRMSDYRPALTGLPTIVVYNFPSFCHIPFPLFKERGGVITATIDRANTCKPEVRTAMFDDLVQKIKLIDALATMKSSRVLLITDWPYLDDDSIRRGDLNITYPTEIRKKPPGAFNEVFREAVDRVFGTEIVHIGTEDVAASDVVKNIDETEARAIAHEWMGNARGMRGTIEGEVVSSARMYLAIRGLMDEYEANASATHIRSLVPDPEPEEMIWPSLGNSQLQMDGIVGCCQGHMNVVLTHMMAQYAFGRPSMMGDIMVEPANGVSVLMHCGAPWNPWGGSEQIPYILRDHAQRRVDGHAVKGAGACSEVLYPADEPATIWRIDVPTRSILVHTGRTIDAYSTYDEWDKIMCRTKLVVDLEDAQKVQNHLYPDVYGVHRTGTLGDFREEIRDIGRLLGFEVIEEDRQ